MSRHAHTTALARRSSAPLVRVRASAQRAARAATHPAMLGASALAAFLLVESTGSWIFFLPLVQIAGYVWRTFLPDQDRGAQGPAATPGAPASLHAAGTAADLWMESAEDVAQALTILRAHGIAPETLEPLAPARAVAALEQVTHRWRAFAPTPLALARDPSTGHSIAWVAARAGVPVAPEDRAVCIPDPDGVPSQVWLLVLLAESAAPGPEQALLARLLGTPLPPARREPPGSSPASPAATMPSGGMARAASPGPAGTDRTDDHAADEDVTGMMARMTEVLGDLGVDAVVVRADVLTTRVRVVLQLGTSSRARDLRGLQQELELRLGVTPVRIEYPVGVAQIALDVPRRRVVPLTLSAVLRQMPPPAAGVMVPVGMTVDGTPVAPPLDAWPHLLIGGATGSGKSTLLHSMLAGMLARHGPASMHVALIDPKGMEFAAYAQLPHLVAPVAQTDAEVAALLADLVHEMESRHRERRTTPRLVLVVDELADVLMRSAEQRRSIEALLVRIAQMGRSAGMHLLMATQRPSADIVTGALKGNLPARIALRVPDRASSMVILDESGAETLLPRIEALYRAPTGQTVLVQPVYAAPPVRDYVLRCWRAGGPLPPRGSAPGRAAALETDEAEVEIPRAGADWYALLEAAACALGHQMGTMPATERRAEVLAHPRMQEALRRATAAGVSANQIGKLLFAAKPGRITAQIAEHMRSGEHA